MAGLGRRRHGEFQACNTSGLIQRRRSDPGAPDATKRQGTERPIPKAVIHRGRSVAALHPSSASSMRHAT